MTAPASISIGGVPGTSPRPTPQTPVTRLAAGVSRRSGTALAALFCAWSGVWLAVWLLAATTVLGALLGFSETALGGGGLAQGPGAGVLSIAGGALAGMAAGLLTALRDLVIGQPLQLLASLAAGLAVSALVLSAIVWLEPGWLRLGGCRRLSRREAARLLPLVEAAAADLGLAELPRLLMVDSGSLRVRARSRHLVIGRGLLEEIGDDLAADQALGAVLCHGLHHWAAGDGAGEQWVLACGLPLAAVYNAGWWLAQQGNSILGLIGWVILWPAWLLARLVVQPLGAARSRRAEYEADAAVLAAGRGAALHRALSFLGELEAGRSGWDRVLADAHPPLELRLEALEETG